MVPSPKFYFVMASLSSYPQEFAREMKEARVRAHLTQAALAERLGVTTRSVQAWEAGVFPRASHRRLIVEFIENGKTAA